MTKIKPQDLVSELNAKYKTDYQVSPKGRIYKEFMGKKMYYTVEELVNTWKRHENEKNSTTNVKKASKHIESLGAILTYKSVYGSRYYDFRGYKVRISDHQWTSEKHREPDFNIWSYKENGYVEMIEMIDMIGAEKLSKIETFKDGGAISIGIGDYTNVGLVEDKTDTQFMIDGKWFHKSLIHKVEKNKDLQLNNIISKLIRENGNGNITLYHGIDNKSYANIIESGKIGVGSGITFFTDNKTEAKQYAKNKSNYRNVSGDGKVIELTIPRYAVKQNRATGEYETEFELQKRDELYVPTEESLLREYPHFKAGGSISSILLAPNGKPSNLTAQQYALVRTIAFKKWFGDWENDPQNASKVLDENGEPMVCYHGTTHNITQFQTTSGEFGSGIYFTHKIETANYFANMSANWNKDIQRHIYECFLNLKNPTIYRIRTAKKTLPLKSTRIKKGYDGVIGYTLNDEIEYLAFYSNQIKLANGQNTSFDGNNNNIRFGKGGNISEPYNYSIGGL